MKRARHRPNQKTKLCSPLSGIALEITSRAVLKGKAVATPLCDYFERMKMRLAENAAVRFTVGHAQITCEEEIGRGIESRR